MTSAQTWDLSYRPADQLPEDADPVQPNGSHHAPVLADPVLADPVLAKPGRTEGAGPQLHEAVQLEPVPPDGEHCRVVLDPALESAKVARDFTRDTLRDWQLEPLVHEAVIIASELVTNAIRHGVIRTAEACGRAGVELSWQRQASRLVCVVTDQNAKPPVLVAADASAESGRGLQVVQAIAAAWGWMLLGAQQKAVWAALLLPSGS